MASRNRLKLCSLYLTGKRPVLERVVAERTLDSFGWFPAMQGTSRHSRSRACVQLFESPHTSCLVRSLQWTKEACDALQEGAGRSVRFHLSVSLGVDGARRYVCPDALLQVCLAADCALTFHLLPCDGHAVRDHKIGTLYAIIESCRPRSFPGAGPFQDRTFPKMRGALRCARLPIRRNGVLHLLSARKNSMQNLHDVYKALAGMMVRSAGPAASEASDCRDRLLFAAEVGAPRKFVRTLTIRPRLLQLLRRHDLRLEMGGYF